MKTSTGSWMLPLLLVLCACDTYSRHVVGLTPEELEKEKITKEELWEENKRLRDENMRLRAAAKKILKENRETAGELETVQAQRDRLQETVQALQAAGATNTPEPVEIRPPEPPPVRARVRIKVLASDGNLETARSTSERIRAAGYPPARLDLSESRHRGTQVYFADGFREQALDMASRLEGAGPVTVKPLSWPSIFDVIVVTDTPR